jgi:hypothetical protein
MQPRLAPLPFSCGASLGYEATRFPNPEKGFCHPPLRTVDPGNYGQPPKRGLRSERDGFGRFMVRKPIIKDRAPLMADPFR